MFSTSEQNNFLYISALSCLKVPHVYVVTLVAAVTSHRCCFHFCRLLL